MYNNALKGSNILAFEAIHITSYSPVTVLAELKHAGETVQTHMLNIERLSATSFPLSEKSKTLPGKEYWTDLSLNAITPRKDSDSPYEMVIHVSFRVVEAKN